MSLPRLAPLLAADPVALVRPIKPKVVRVPLPFSPIDPALLEPCDRSTSSLPPPDERDRIQLTLARDREITLKVRCADKFDALADAVRASQGIQ